ncbi:hypothetical protein T4B_5955 [Trichinella pseudospiralis]|uniref:Uncharacterized protein n=1 Tax=Trichinella pseudospiralis TaxID=6337 RepID=A0A0V1GDR9_TRIPS|nr:hypothetical protein T4A_2144 [Trichinella pseudospiralis]KRY96376.1 hypothetical protein T4C_4808 [Trichinella pseudospiralis]KRY97793.1 hypothetical protein T4B_5955 [Trichinella pseudospiralis]KRY99881.1 hypothetical protein T4C_9276 [Trichinella pseudospiralis]KRZ00329.1 hypothetical protein T4C_13880 [Trichinella pseudospiralis]
MKAIKEIFCHMLYFSLVDFPLIYSVECTLQC